MEEERLEMDAGDRKRLHVIRKVLEGEDQAKKRCGIAWVECSTDTAINAGSLQPGRCGNHTQVAWPAVESAYG